MPRVWDLLGDVYDEMPRTKESKQSDKILYAAALAHANQTHTRTIETISHPDSKILALAAEAFRHDFEKVLPQSVRDAISYAGLPYATAHQQARLPLFSSDKIPEAYKKLVLKDTSFTIDVERLRADAAGDATVAAKKWISFLDFLGDANCGYIREMVFHFENVAIHVNFRSRVFPADHDKAGQIRAPVTCFRLEAALGRPCFLKKNGADFHQASDWARQAFQKITNDRERFVGAGRFGMRDVNKVGKVIFRLPALCCWLQRKRRGYGDKERDGGGAHSRLLEVPERCRSPSCVVDLPTEGELRVHADGCGECRCAWVSQADGAL